MKALAYLRVRSKGQVEGDGFPRQRASIQKFATDNGYLVGGWFEEKDASGTVGGSDRKVWHEVQAEARETGSVIIIEKLDRLARDLMFQEIIIRDLRRHNVALISVAEPDLGSVDPPRTMMRQIIGSVAQYDKSQLVAKLKVGRDRKKQQTGRCEGVKPYGTLPGESAVVHQIATMARAGLGGTAIARALNQLGIQPRRARKWHPFTISGILEGIAKS